MEIYALLQLQLQLHNSCGMFGLHECSDMFMHAARFLDLSCCCRLNANGTFFDFDSKNEWPRQAAFDDDLLLPIAHCPLPILAATNWLLLHIAHTS